MDELDLTTNYYLLIIYPRQRKVESVAASKDFLVLEDSVKRMRKRLKPSPVLDFQIGSGNEIAGMFRLPDAIYQAVRNLRGALFVNHKLQFTVAIGRIGVVTDNIFRVAGSITKKSKHLKKELADEHLFCAWDVGNNQLSAALVSLCEKSNRVFEKMTRPQRELYRLLSTGKNMDEIVIELGKQSEEIARQIKRSGAEKALRAEATVDSILKSM